MISVCSKETEAKHPVGFFFSVGIGETLGYCKVSALVKGNIEQIVRRKVNFDLAVPVGGCGIAFGAGIHYLGFTVQIV